MSNSFTQAIYIVYPEVVRTEGNLAFNADGDQVDYDSALVQIEANKLDCSNQAKAILQATDWTSIGDVGNPQLSNPYLVNQAEFIAYRSQVRALAVNPVENPVFPTAPTEQWSS